MKKFVSMLLVLTLSFSLAACAGTPAAKNIEGDLSTLMKNLLAKVDLDAETKEWLTTGLLETPLTAENTQYYLGKADYSFKEALSAEPMMSAQALSIVLVRAEDAAAAQKLATEVPTTVDPNKWICVGVDPSNVKAASIGDLMVLVMADNAQKYLDAFQTLAE